jgi:hypothetical protein
MGGFADELRAGIDQAARNMTEARSAGDDYGAEVYHERLHYLKRVALHHGVEAAPCREPAAPGEGLR